MNQLSNISIIQKLYSVLNDLSDLKDKKAILKIINKMQDGSEYLKFDVNELAKLTGIEVGHQCIGVTICRRAAEKYVASTYNVDTMFYHHHGGVLKMERDFATMRAYIRKTSSPESIKIKTLTFDMYVTTVFIEKYIQIKNKKYLNEEQD